MEDKTTSDVRLSVSIVLYNSPLELLKRTLNSLHISARRAQQSQLLAQVEVQLIDNSPGSANRTRMRETLEAWPSDKLLTVSYFATGENRGFGAGHNLAMQSVDSDYHLILNPDAELNESTLEVGLASLKEDRGIVLVSPEVSGDDGAQEFLCKRYPSILVLVLRAFAPRFVRRLFRPRLNRYEMRDVCSGPEEAEVIFASGCFMLARTEALRSVGGFDERYFVYFEDFDLSLRIGGKGRIVYLPNMKIVHHGGYAARKGSWHVKLFIRSGIEFFNKHGWRWI